MLKKSLFFLVIIYFFRDDIKGQAVFPIYYMPVEMPAFLKTNYYGQFDTKLLAGDLAGLLRRATGISFEIKPYEKNSVKGIFLLLDSSLSMGNETGVVESDGKKIITIKARYTTGISYAMYSWLEKIGFHFYLPGDEWTIIPVIKNIFTNKKFKQVYKPYFRLRMFSTSGGIFPVKGLDEGSQNEKEWQQWHLRNRMGCDYLGIDGHVGELFNIVHKTEIEKDSMILAPVNGKRQYSVEGKLDPTNPKAVAMFSDWIVDEFKANSKRMPSFLPIKKYYTVDAGDGLNYCHTPGCEQQFKNVSDQAFSITNATARKIRSADSRAGVSTLAYTERADTPTIKIEPNVHVMVVPTGFQSVSTATELMQRWAKKTGNISQYDFLNIGVWAYDAPFYNLYQYYNNLQFLQSLKIEGMNFETSLSKFSSGIQQYFILKFLCDPYPSIEKILDEFCKNSFGKAAPPIKKLLKEWYFSNTHLNTTYEKSSFYEDELGRFVKYISEAENTPGIGTAVTKRIEELKAYLIYLCKFYELFTKQENQQLFATKPSLRAEKTTELLTYTWQLYHSKIFHNTQLNDMLKKDLPDNKKQEWDFRSSDDFKNIHENTPAAIQTAFEEIKQRYLPAASSYFPLSNEFLSANVQYSADSILITTIDEKAFGYFLYPIEFYCATPCQLLISYHVDYSFGRNNRKEKIALVSVESADYAFTKTRFIYKDNTNGKLGFQLPAKGHYKLFLSQYNTTHVSYTIYPGSNLFYINKNVLPMNGILLQDNNVMDPYSNKYLAFLAPAEDSIYFSNLYWNTTNTIKLFSPQGKSILINSSRQPLLNAAPIPKSIHPRFIFFENGVFRWPPILKNTAPYYFFLKYPLK